MRFEISADTTPRPDERRVEIVERKGLGHPDTICDAVAEAFSLALSRFYLEQTGRILHHNVDKVLLAAGSSRPRFGGGEIVAPIQILLAGRATSECEGVRAPIEALAARATRHWLARHLRALDAERHVRVTSLVRPGSSELVSLFEAQGRASPALANDTSCGVGFAPLSELERVVLAVEQRLNSDAAHALAPALGEDVKVMAIRDGEAVELTVACAMIDRHLGSTADYVGAVQSAGELALGAAREITSLPVQVGVNVADDLEAQRLYLTVTGTSAEAGDDGQAGRGNRANGLITPGRPMTIESVAGKNPVTHVGKLYSIAANLIAERLATALGGIRAAECRLVSRIGQPIEEPWLVEVRLTGVDPTQDAGLRREVERVVQGELDQLPTLAAQLVGGALRLDRWPLRA